MKSNASEIKDTIKTLGREIKSIVTYNDTEYIEELLSVTPLFTGNILKSVMKQLDIESTIAFPVNSIVNYRLGVKVNEEYKYLNFGDYVVYSVEKQEDSNSYKIVCYDKLLYSMKDYEALNITYPITVKNYLTSICTAIGLQFDSSKTFYNMNKQIPSDLFVGIGFTYRDILDQISQVVGGSIIYNSATNKVEVKYPTETSDVIDEEFLKDINVTFGEKYGPVNSIVLSRSGESDNVYIRDEESIELNGLCEVKIIDNQIMNFNDRDQYLQGILDALNGSEYYINDFSSTGICYYDYMDIYHISCNGNSYKCLMLNDEINLTSGIEETIYTEMPEESETDYTKADKTDQRINQTYIIVDKQNQQIESVINNVTEQDNKIARVTQTVDELNSKISDIADITTSQETITGRINFTNINASEPVRIVIRPTGQQITYKYPFTTGQYPSNTNYIQLRTVRFTNLTTEEVFDYNLPDDLLYIDEDVYDEFILDYDAYTVEINKKCKYNADGTISALTTPKTNSYTFPRIPLTDGDYKIEVLKYDNAVYPCYLFARLMAQNIYTTQFATKVEMNSEISQTKEDITLSVNQKLTAYPTTQEMNAAISVSAGAITSTVSETYATKVLLDNYETKTNATNQYNTIITRVSTVEQTAEGLTTTVSTKVGNNEVISKINQSSEAITINANKISLAGKTINLTSDNMEIKSTNFSVDKTGKITAVSGKIGGFNITDKLIYSNYVGMSNSTYSGDPSIWAGASSPYGRDNWYNNTPFFVTNQGKLVARNAEINGTIKATSGEFQNCTIKNSCTVPASTINGTLSSGNIPTISGDKISGGSIGAYSLAASFYQIYADGNFTAKGLDKRKDVFREGKSESNFIPVLAGNDSGGQQWIRLRFVNGIYCGYDTDW